MKEREIEREKDREYERAREKSKMLTISTVIYCDYVSFYLIVE